MWGSILKHEASRRPWIGARLACGSTKIKLARALTKAISSSCVLSTGNAQSISARQAQPNPLLSTRGAPNKFWPTTTNTTKAGWRRRRTIVHRCPDDQSKTAPRRVDTRAGEANQQGGGRGRGHRRSVCPAVNSSPLVRLPSSGCRHWKGGGREGATLMARRCSARTLQP